MSEESARYSHLMDEKNKLEKQLKDLEEENNYLKAKCEELHCMLTNLQESVDTANDEAINEMFHEGGCVVIEGMQRSAAYQDVVGVLLMNDYTVELEPIEQGRRLKITIKESEV